MHQGHSNQAIRAAIKELKQLQDNLGDFQDADVQIAALKGFAMEMRRLVQCRVRCGRGYAFFLQPVG